MKKYLLTLTFISGFIGAANAQMSTGTSKKISLELPNAISVKFANNAGITDPVVKLALNSTDNYSDGAVSDEQQIMVHSTDNFSVTIQSTSNNFDYKGSQYPAPKIPVSSLLQLMVTENNTGGMSNNKFINIRPGASTIIDLGSTGPNKTFSIKYKANPAGNLPGGIYSTNIIYSIMQP